MRNNEERIGTKEDHSTPTTISPLDFVTPISFVELPSKGLFYPDDHPLHNQETIEVKEMTAKEEDILTSRELAKKGLIIDRLVNSLMVDKSIKSNSLLVGDKNAILIRARINAYGAEYKTSVTCPACGEPTKHQFDLEEIQETKIELLEGVERLSNNNIMITLSNGWEVECKMLIGKDELKLVQESERKRKKKLPESPLTDLLNSIIISVSGHDDQETIKKAVAFMPAKDTRFLREAYRATIPNVDMSQSFTCSGCDMKRIWRCRLVRNSFGLSDEYSKNVYETFFFMKYYGGWSFVEAYNLPVGLRTWFVERLQEQLKEESDAMKKASKRR